MLRQPRLDAPGLLCGGVGTGSFFCLLTETYMTGGHVGFFFSSLFFPIYQLP